MACIILISSIVAGGIHNHSVLKGSDTEVGDRGSVLREDMDVGSI